MKKRKGFTLIELMIVVAIIGVVSAIAFPSYNAYMIQSRRGDAMRSLARIADLQERYYLQNNTYATTLALLNVTSPITPLGYYTLTIPTANVTGFTITATAIDIQVADIKCLTLSIDSTDLKTSTPAGNQCW